MKKATYIILIMSSMGFTIAPHKQPGQELKERRIINDTTLKTGYLEVSSPASYSLTTGS